MSELIKKKKALSLTEARANAKPNTSYYPREESNNKLSKALSEALNKK